MNIVTHDIDTKRILSKVAKKVDNPQSTETVLGIQEMKRLAHRWEQETGIRCEGLAANQIGWDKRVIILRSSDEMVPRDPRLIPNNTSVFATEDDFNRQLSIYKKWVRVRGAVYDPWFVLINPQIVEVVGSQYSTEGCLSCPGSTYKVLRPEQILFKYQLPNGKRSKLLIVKGYNATVLQHEIDHLHGITIREHAIEAYIGEAA